MQHNTFNIVQLIIAVAVVAVSTSLFIACGDSGGQADEDKLSDKTLEHANQAANNTRWRFQTMTQLRAIHQAIITYSNSNKSYYPGLKANGNNDRVTVEERYALLLDGDFVPPEYVISPFETSPPKTGFSFAMLQLPEQGWRRHEWRQTLNSQAAVMSDRNIGTEQAPDGLVDGADWEFAVLWNDNHVGVNETDVIQAKYGDTTLEPDKLFSAAGDDDALLIHSGN